MPAGRIWGGGMIELKKEGSCDKKKELSIRGKEL